jgi:hypothetical protein
MIFRMGNATYRDAELQAYRTSDFDLLIVTAPPENQFFFKITATQTSEISEQEADALIISYKLGRPHGKKRSASAA